MIFSSFFVVVAVTVGTQLNLCIRYALRVPVSAYDDIVCYINLFLPMH